MLVSLAIYCLLVLLVLANILFGCYIAVQLGYGPPDWKTTLHMLVDLRRCRDVVEKVKRRFPALGFLRLSFLEHSPAPEKSHAVPPEKPAEPEKSPSNELSFESAIEKWTTTDVGDLLEDEADDLSDLAPMQEIFDDDLASVLMEQGTESWLVNEKHVETSLLKLNTVMMKSGRFAAELDWRIRAGRGSLSREDVK